jgi:hypothetical protein
MKVTAIKKVSWLRVKKGLLYINAAKKIGPMLTENRAHCYAGSLLAQMAKTFKSLATNTKDVNNMISAICVANTGQMAT